MNDFFNSISEILNQPEDASTRNLAVLQGQTLAQNISQMQQQVTSLRSDVNDQVQSMAGDINQDIETICSLNVKIAQTEGGSISKSDAVGLTDLACLGPGRPRPKKSTLTPSNKRTARCRFTPAEIIWSAGALRGRSMWFRTATGE